MADETEKMNHTNGNDGVYVNISSSDHQLLTLHALLYRLISTIIDSSSSPTSGGLIRRIKISFADNIPLFPEASRNTSSLLLAWARRGSPLRSILLISAGTITLLNLTGLLLFTLFFAAAIFNAVVVSLLFSLAAAGGFVAISFACLTAVYITALSVAAFVISVTTISTVIAVFVATGWIGFFCSIWLVAKTSFGFAKHSLAVTGSTLSAYSFASSRYHPLKHSD